MITRICLLGILSMLLLVVRATEGFSTAAKDKPYQQLREEFLLNR